MAKVKDLTGMKFGRLTVLERVKRDCRKACWLCKCECGNICTVQGDNLRNGHTVSCGCFKKEYTSERSKTHGMRNSRIYKTWQGIKTRCFSPNRKDYEDYGGRGITMFPAWVDDFPAFFSYVSQLPHYDEGGYSLDRTDNNGNYEPGNLRWATKSEQARNRRSNRIVEYEGEKMTLAEAAEKSGIDYPVLLQRVHRGWADRHLFAPNQGQIQRGAPPESTDK